jgi:hypothetical protein
MVVMVLRDPTHRTEEAMGHIATTINDLKVVPQGTPGAPQHPSASAPLILRGAVERQDSASAIKLRLKGEPSVAQMPGDIRSRRGSRSVSRRLEWSSRSAVCLDSQHVAY